jgi:hypothetical protein
MRRMPISVAAAAALALLVVGTAGCGGKPAGVTPVAHAPVAHAPAGPARAGPARAGVAEADIYAQVLRRYLSTPAENSFPGQAFKTVYVLDQAYRDAADPDGKHERGAPITAPVQHQVMADLAGMARVVFIASRYSVIEARGGCGQVKNGGILITLGPPAVVGHQVHVAVNGWVACLGATWLTYILQRQPGSGWRVTGTTGTMAIS